MRRLFPYGPEDDKEGRHMLRMMVWWPVGVYVFFLVYLAVMVIWEAVT